MGKIEDKLRDLAIYSPDDYKEVDVNKEIIQPLKLKTEKQYMGQLSRVHRILGKPWMVKEARWDLSMELFAGKHLPFPVRLTSWIMKKFSFTFLPDQKEILKQYGMYLEFAQYFGYFKDDKTFYHKNREIIFNSQKYIRESLMHFKPVIERKYKFKIDDRIESILNSKIKYHNFLPKEYLLIGPSISPENKGKTTSLIFQEFIDGDVLRDIPDKDLEENDKKQLVLMIYLILLMNAQVNLVPDTRPKYHVFEAYNWLTNTDNIIVKRKGGLIFVDTRWFWETEANLIKRGILITDLIINRAKVSINDLIKDINQ